MSALLDRLNEVENELWAYQGELDLSIRSVAENLSEDLAEAQASCQANATSCSELNSLVSQIDSFVNNLNTLETELVRGGQEARIY